jgi:hypothetical protein
MPSVGIERAVVDRLDDLGKRLERNFRLIAAAAHATRIPLREMKI